MENTRAKGLNATQLKLIALVLMTVDHIYLFLAPVTPLPYFMRILGRIAAPIFIWFIAEAAEKTSSRGKLALRLYLINAGMLLVNFYLTGGEVDNRILGTMLYIVVICACIINARATQGGTRAVWIALIFAALAVPVLAGIVAEGTPFKPIVAAFLPTIFGVEGSYILVGLGVGLFVASSKKLKLIVLSAFCAVYLVWTLVSHNFYLPPMFHADIQWLQLLAIPLLALYNGERGVGLKYLFYIYYPAHVYALWGVARIVGGK